MKNADSDKLGQLGWFNKVLNWVRKIIMRRHCKNIIPKLLFTVCMYSFNVLIKYFIVVDFNSSFKNLFLPYFVYIC